VKRLRPAIVALLCGVGPGCQAAALRFCDQAVQPSAAQLDRLLRFGDIIKSELERSGAQVAIVARSGLDLSRFGLRHSHAGFSLRESPNAPWSVRQLYYACDEGRPRLFDQGMAGFLLGTSDPDIGYVSALLLPPQQAARVEHQVRDDAAALQLLGGSYSANAFPFDPRHQNCNQWVIEMLATAWLPPPARGGAEPPPRVRAQHWLRDQGYAPTRIEVQPLPLMWLGAFIPWVHSDDHPAEDLARQSYRVSLPASIDAFVRRQVPGTGRLEFCHDEHRVVIRRGWAPIAEGCVPDEHDEVVALD
jgi:hypothetical protein